MSDDEIPESETVDGVERLRGLTDADFRRWLHAAGAPELGEILLWRWDPAHVAADFPLTRERYAGVAESLVLGLRAGNGREEFLARATAHDEREPSLTGAEAVWKMVPLWLRRSIERWEVESLLGDLLALPFHAHVIKYDPAKSVDGHYDDGTWISISQIGSSFNGEVLSEERYAEVEQAHLTTLAAMAEESGVTGLVAAFEPAVLTTADALEQVRGVLRETSQRWLWHSPDRTFCITVGFDYHVYCASHTSCDGSLRLAHEMGLHPRLDGPSPYLTYDP